MSNTIKIKVLGDKELKKRLKDLSAEGKQEVTKQLNLNALDYVNSVRKSIRRNTGKYRPYKRGGRTHWSSRPGTPPNSDTGNLVRRIEVTRISRNGKPAIVKSGAKYSAALEFARKKKRKRPFMLPMLEARRKLYTLRIKRAIRKLL